MPIRPEDLSMNGLQRTDLFQIVLVYRETKVTRGNPGTFELCNHIAKFRQGCLELFIGRNCGAFLFRDRAGTFRKPSAQSAEQLSPFSEFGLVCLVSALCGGVIIPGTQPKEVCLVFGHASNLASRKGCGKSGSYGHPAPARIVRRRPGIARIAKPKGGYSYSHPS